MSAWDEVNTGEGENGVDAGQASGGSRAGPINDGFEEPAHAGEGNDADLTVDHEEHADSGFEDARPAKKKGPNPKVIAAIFGLVVVSAVGLLGWKAASVMMARKGGSATKVATMAAEPVETMPVGLPRDAHATVLGSEPAASAATSAEVNVTATSPAIAPAPAAQATAATPPAPTAPAASAAMPSAAPALATIAAPAVVPVQAPAVAPFSRRGEEPAAAAELQDLKKQVAALKAELDRVTTRAAAAPTHVAATDAKPAKVVAHRAPQAVKRDAVHGNDAAAATPRQPREVILGGEVIQQQVVLPGMKLRGVYPPTGDDRQAWVLLGDAVQIVSKGTVIGGATVVKIESDRIVTDRGLIR